MVSYVKYQIKVCVYIYINCLKNIYQYIHITYILVLINRRFQETIIYSEAVFVYLWKTLSFSKKKSQISKKPESGLGKHTSVTSCKQVRDDQRILILSYLLIISVCQKSVSKIYFSVCHHRCVIILIIRDVIHLIMTLY